MDSKIENIISRQILDSRGIPTIETEIILKNGIKGRASVPSGASTGKNEALEKRDNNKNSFNGKSVYTAINNIENIIKPALLNIDVHKQRLIDTIMIDKDGTENKSNLGANAILSVSLAAARAASKYENIELYKYLGGIYAIIMPVPMMNIINGGVHANNNLDFQEFMIQPVRSKNINESLKMGTEVFHKLKEIINTMGYSTAVGDEGGFAPEVKTNTEAIEMIIYAIEEAGYSTEEIKICIDAASSELYKDGKYFLSGEEKELCSREMTDYLEKLVNNYPVISIEDGLSQDDYSGWRELTKRLGEKCQIVGDDLFVTNYKRLEFGIENNIANSILIKLNQIGTLTETLDTILLAQKNNYKTIISHRSGETEDTFIADLSIAVNSGQIKTGSLSRGERIAKYNRLIRIEEDLQKRK